MNPEARESWAHIRLSRRELLGCKAMAKREKLPVGTYVRRLLLLEMDRVGLALPDPEELKAVG